MASTSDAEMARPKAPTMAEVLAATKPADWRALDPENTLYVEFATGRVVMSVLIAAGAPPKPQILWCAPMVGDGAPITTTTDGKSEPKPTGTPHFERGGWVHQWANPGAAPLVLIQANISQEGVPAVIAGDAK